MQNSFSITSSYFSTSASTCSNTKKICLDKPAKCIVQGLVNANETDCSKRKEMKQKSAHKKLKRSGVLNADDIFLSSCSNNRTPTYGLNRLKYNFYDVSCLDLAKGLLGQILVRRLNDGTILKGRIVETECYLGGEDKASHSYNGRITERTKPMYMKPGTAYVYFTYGMYHCFNISSQGPGAVVLLRAVEPLEGLEYMHQERGKRKKNTSSTKELKVNDLCNGPGKLCISFDITKSSSNEKDLSWWDGMWIEKDESNQKPLNPCHVVTSHRIGIDSVGFEWASKPLRFYLLGNSSVSRRDKVREKELQDMMKYFVT